jgi:hypothetical protein
VSGSSLPEARSIDGVRMPISKLVLVLFSAARMIRGPESSTQF